MQGEGLLFCHRRTREVIGLFFQSTHPLAYPDSPLTCHYAHSPFHFFSRIPPLPPSLGHLFVILSGAPYYVPVSHWLIFPTLCSASLFPPMPTSRRFRPGLWLWLWLRLLLRPGPREPREPRELLEPLEELLPAVEQVLVPWPWLRKLGLPYGSQASSAAQPRSAAEPTGGSRLSPLVHWPTCTLSQLWVITERWALSV